MARARRDRTLPESVRCRGTRRAAGAGVKAPSPHPDADGAGRAGRNAQAAGRRTAFSLSVSVRNTMASAHVIHAAKARVRIIGGLLVPAEGNMRMTGRLALVRACQSFAFGHQPPPAGNR